MTIATPDRATQRGIRKWKILGNRGEADDGLRGIVSEVSRRGSAGSGPVAGNSPKGSAPISSPSSNESLNV
tara:strand:+ start:192 stop:404 length:213 start_codon:yes stop_codon:yes gene_type:complete